MPDTLSLKLNYLDAYHGTLEITKQYEGFRNVTLLQDTGPRKAWLPFTPDDLKKLRDFLIEQYPLEAPAQDYDMVLRMGQWEVRAAKPREPSYTTVGTFVRREDAEDFLAAKRSAA